MGGRGIGPFKGLGYRNDESLKFLGIDPKGPKDGGRFRLPLFMWDCEFGYKSYAASIEVGATGSGAI